MESAAHTENSDPSSRPCSRDPSGRYPGELPSLPTLVFDGGCDLCTLAAHFAEAQWRTPARAIAYQELDEDDRLALGLSGLDASRAAWWIDGAGARSGGHLTIASSLAASGPWQRRFGALMTKGPLSHVAAHGYAWFAPRHRSLSAGIARMHRLIVRARALVLGRSILIRSEDAPSKPGAVREK